MNHPFLVWYVTGHGFGHATRVCAVLQHLPDSIDVEIVTSVPRWLFDRSLARPFGYRQLLHDPGLVQKDSVLFDPEATAAIWRDLLNRYPLMAQEEAERYKQSSPLAVSDISPFGALVAEKLGTQAVCLANFSWNWILGPSIQNYEPLAEIAAELAEIYHRFGLLLRTPFHGDLSVFSRVRDVSLVVRRPSMSRDEARKHFNLPTDQPVVLYSFGGHSQAGLTDAVLKKYSDILFINFEDDRRLPNLRTMPRETYHPDLVAASDVVFCKLGYGIVGEVLASQAAVFHLERQNFPEFEMFEQQLPRYIRMKRVSRGDFELGKWDGLYELLEARHNEPPLAPYTDLDGGREVAQILEDLAERGEEAWQDLY